MDLKVNMFLNNDSYMTRSTVIDLNPAELNLYPFMISLDKCDRNYIDFDNLPIKVCVQRKTKCVNVKVVNMITRINESETIVEHSSCL